MIYLDLIACVTLWTAELLTLWLDPWQIQLRCSPLWDFGLRTLFDALLQLRSWNDFQDIQLITEGSTNACQIGFPFFFIHLETRFALVAMLHSSWRVGHVEDRLLPLAWPILTPSQHEIGYDLDEGSVKKCQEVSFKKMRPKNIYKNTGTNVGLCILEEHILLFQGVPDHSESILLACNCTGMTLINIE